MSKIADIIFWLGEIILLIWLVESSGIITGSGFWLLFNLFILGLEYNRNPEFKQWFDTTVMVGIREIERRLYKNGKAK